MNKRRSNKKDEIVLNEEQEETILKMWNEGVQDLKPLIVACFGDNYDGRSKQGFAVKKFLSSKKLKAKPAHVRFSKTDQITLTKEQEEFIINNVERNSVLELTKEIFNNQYLTNLSAEFKVVARYIELSGLVQYRTGTDEDVPLGDYKPPKNFDQAITRINRYKLDAFDKSRELTQIEKGGIKALIKFLHTPRLTRELSSITDEGLRILFESSFVRFTYNKPDLTEEEIDAYINLCLDIVGETTIRRQIARLSRLQNQQAENTEGARMSVALATSIHDAQTELDQNRKRQEKLRESLQGKRISRIDKVLQENASILNLVALWKSEKDREKMIKLADFQNERLSKEIDRFTDMDEVRAKVMGVSKEEILNG